MTLGEIFHSIIFWMSRCRFESRITAGTDIQDGSYLTSQAIFQVVRYIMQFMSTSYRFIPGGISLPL